MTQLPERKALRLPGFDYTKPGAYFVTICTLRRRCLFGRVVNGSVRLSTAGKIVEEEWLLTATRRPYIALDAHVIMPNHVHGLIVIQEPSRSKARCNRGAPPHSLSSVIGNFKAAASRRIAMAAGDKRFALWQRSYYESIVRNTHELYVIRQYITNNPARWRDG